ncbi:hypothetical protein ACP4OV_026259 [Aristida adscensionis]
MGNMEQHLGNATSTTFIHQLRALWKSPRGTVLRIEALALVAIVLTFLVVAFASCRRWSNRWIVQKGFLAANVLSLSLGTYSIGLMQSSSVKSKMYPIWAVSLLTLFGCVDSITTYNGLDYKSPLSKMVFQLCLYCGYVLLMSISTISSDVVNIAIGVLSAITFIKGFHRSMALVLPSRMRNMIVQCIGDNGSEQGNLANLDDFSRQKKLHVDIPLDMDEPLLALIELKNGVDMGDIQLSCKDKGELQSHVSACHDVCIAFSLSHLLQRRFLGLTDIARRRHTHEFERYNVDYKRVLKVIEIELAFLYEVFFTSNAFLHYYQAKTANNWAFASFVGICFVMLAVAIPGTMTSHGTAPPGPAAGSIFVDTTSVDVIITLVILASLALLQLVQLIRCWTSNWARVSFACEYVRSKKHQISWPMWWMRLQAFLVTKINWFDNYLWQDKIGQYSVVEGSSRRDCCNLFSYIKLSGAGCLQVKCASFLRILGLQYIGQVLRELLGSKTGGSIELHPDVKASVAGFLCQIKSYGTGQDWSSLLVANGVNLKDLPYTPHYVTFMTDAYAFTSRVMIWHIATCYCELVECRQVKQKERTDCNKSAGEEREKNRRVAIALSKYCAYLVVSAPELLPGPSADTTRAYDEVAFAARAVVHGAKDKLEAMQMKAGDRLQQVRPSIRERIRNTNFWKGVNLGKQLLDCSDPWKVMALLWVQALVYAAPYGNVEAHMQHLSQGGEFITHVWAFLYHSGICKWKTGRPRWEEESSEEEEIPQDGGGHTEHEVTIES